MTTTIQNEVKRKHPDALCEECPLYGKPCAPTMGPADSKTIFVSRSPGYHEAMSGKPFQGPGGKVLDHLLGLNGVKRDDIRVTNVVLCAPDAGKVPPEAIKACAPRVAKELESANLILAGGSEAVNLILGRGTIDKYRGYRIDRDGQTIVATNNPALVLRDDSTFPNLVKDFKRAFHPIPPPILPTVEVIYEPDAARNYLRSLLATPARVATDIESVGGLSQFAEPFCIQFSTEGRTATVLSADALYRDSNVLHDLATLLESKEHTFIWHNGKFDVKILNTFLGIETRVDEDTMLLSYACDERGGVHSLEYLLMEEFGWPNYEPDSVKAFKREGRVVHPDLLSELYNYAGFDAAGTYQLFDLLTERAKKDNVYEMYRKRLLPSNSLALTMESHGFRYDINEAADILELEILPELEELEHRMQEIVDMPLLNPKSTKHMPILYYDKWGIKHAMQGRPDKYRSVDKEARKEILDGRFTIPEDYLKKTDEQKERAKERRGTIVSFVKEHHRYSTLQKQASTYLLSLIERAESDAEQRIYTDLLIHGTTSGRLSSRNPNLQNITRSKAGIPSIRNLFRASPGRLIVEADYSQAELRAIAALSGDTLLAGVYQRAEDLHNLSAERFYGKGYSPEQRTKAKSMNFGVFYRQSAATFLEKHGIPEAEAQKYIDWVWQTFLGVKEWEKSIEKEILTRGTLISPFGRKRRFYLITSENKQASFREGINFYPQTIANDLTLGAAVRLNDEIDGRKANLCLTVHDSIIADVNENYVSEYEQLCKQVMEATPSLELGWTLPFTADAGHGPSWGECK